MCINFTQKIDEFENPPQKFDGLHGTHAKGAPDHHHQLSTLLWTTSSKTQ